MTTLRKQPLTPVENLTYEEKNALRQQAYDRVLRLREDNFDQANTFELNVGGKYPKTCYLFLSLKEGKLHILSGGTVLKSHYTQADHAESARLRSEAPIQHGQGVNVGGAVYRVAVNGDYSDAGYLEHVCSL